MSDDRIDDRRPAANEIARALSLAPVMRLEDAILESCSDAEMETLYKIIRTVEMIGAVRELENPLRGLWERPAIETSGPCSAAQDAILDDDQRREWAAEGE